MAMKCIVTLLCSCIFVSSSLSCQTDNDILVDIIFVVDGSGSIGEGNFDLVKSWLINATTEMFNAFGSRAQFEVLEYSNKDPDYKGIPIAKSALFEIPFRLGECESVKCMSSRIQHMEYLASSTYTYYALRRTMEVEFPLSIHYPESKKAIILLTDGAANDGALLPRAFDASVQEDITNFAIGIGDYRLDELKTIANGGVTNERVYTRTNFESLASVIRALEDELGRDGFFCDECSSGSDNCSVNARCINTPDSFLCECKEGYHGDGITCEQFDYCENNPCLETRHSVCIVEDNLPRCICEPGFREENGNCVDIDECEPNPCTNENSMCVDLVGEYTCTCEKGYHLDGTNCVESVDPPNDTIVIITFLLTIILIIVLIVYVVMKTRRRGSFSPNADFSESYEDEDEVPLHQIMETQANA